MISLRTALSSEQPTEPPLPWLVRNHDLVAIALCLCIAAVTAFAIGHLK